MPGTDRNILRRSADVDQAPAEPRRRGLELRHIGQSLVHAADDVEAGLERFDQRRDPAVVDDATGIGDADHESTRAAGARFLRRQPRQTGRDRGACARPFTDDAVTGPVAKTKRSLGIAGLGRVAEEQQVRLRQRFER